VSQASCKDLQGRSGGKAAGQEPNSGSSIDRQETEIPESHAVSKIGIFFSISWHSIFPVPIKLATPSTPLENIDFPLPIKIHTNAIQWKPFRNLIYLSLHVLTRDFDRTPYTQTGSMVFGEDRLED